jgi:hypothetical protein
MEDDMSEQCISCGMSLEKPEDRAAQDPDRDYCLHCARPDGSMKSYDEVLEGMAGFMVKTQGLAEAPAREAARAMMAKLPAWKDRPGGSEAG